MQFPLAGLVLTPVRSFNIRKRRTDMVNRHFLLFSVLVIGFIAIPAVSHACPPDYVQCGDYCCPK
jgi:hypothetical protein